MSEKHLCQLCGEPMPEGEEMFNYHGYSGDCPKPPLQKTEVMAEYIFRDTRDGEFWIDVKVNRIPYQSVGPFDTASERQRAHDDLLQMVRSLGGKDVPALPQ
jgi:hypothetical protein